MLWLPHPGLCSWVSETKEPWSSPRTVLEPFSGGQSQPGILRAPAQLLPGTGPRRHWLSLCPHPLHELRGQLASFLEGQPPMLPVPPRSSPISLPAGAGGPRPEIRLPGVSSAWQPVAPRPAPFHVSAWSPHRRAHNASEDGDLRACPGRCPVLTWRSSHNSSPAPSFQHKKGLAVPQPRRRQKSSPGHAACVCGPPAGRPRRFAAETAPWSAEKGSGRGGGPPLVPARLWEVGSGPGLEGTP